MRLATVRTLPCPLVAASTFTSSPMTPIKGKVPPFSPITAAAFSPPSATADKPLPPWLASPVPLVLQLVP